MANPIKNAEPVSGYPLRVGSHTVGNNTVIKVAVQKAVFLEKGTKKEAIAPTIKEKGKRYMIDKLSMYTIRDWPKSKIKGAVRMVCKSL
jgi:hypothetical protein